MKLTHDQVQDLLEGYALWALDGTDRSAVEDHLAGCEACRRTVRELGDVVAAIPETIVERTPSARLRDRVLAAARADVARQPRPVMSFRPAWAVSVALFVVALASGGLALRAQLDLASVRADRDAYLAIAQKVSEGGRWWYMAGSGSFDGSGGTLIDPKKDGQAFVLFHDLKPIAPDARYAVWLIRADGGWVRAANFWPSADALQRVDVPLAVGDFVQCAVTIETRDSGSPQGDLAMQSRVFGQ